MFIQDDEFFTSASDMHLLLRVERKLAHELLAYIKRERNKIQLLEQQVADVERLHQLQKQRFVRN